MRDKEIKQLKDRLTKLEAQKATTREGLAILAGIMAFLIFTGAVAWCDSNLSPASVQTIYFFGIGSVLIAYTVYKIIKTD